MVVAVGTKRKSGFPERIQASLTVAIGYLVIAAGILGFGIWLVLDGLSGHETLQRSAIGILSIVLAVGVGREAGELCFITMDDNAIEQLRFFRRGRLLARTRITWEEVRSVRTEGFWVYLKSASSEIRINLSFFNDMSRAVAFLEGHLLRGAGSKGS